LLGPFVNPGLLFSNWLKHVTHLDSTDFDPFQSPVSITDQNQINIITAQRIFSPFLFYL